MKITDIKNPVLTNFGDWISKYGDLWQKQLSEIQQKFGLDIEEVKYPIKDPVDVPIVYVKVESVLSVLRHLKEAPGFEYGFLADLTATDEFPEEKRFEVVYNLLSHSNSAARIRVKTRIKESQAVPTVTSLWQGANWAEREVFDMFGVKFEGHPNLRRILMDERWEGHPLRKDYPIRKYQIFPTPQVIDQKLLKD